MAQAAPVRKEADLSGPFGVLLKSRQRVFRNSSGDIPACLRMARKVPSGISPGWLGIVVYRSVSAWNQISCDPCRLPVESETERPHASGNLPAGKARQPSHLCRYPLTTSG